jgi:hypothetical protein
MKTSKRISISPGTAIALVALFFALGGSAFAVGQSVTAAQQRCANGAVRGIAMVTGNPSAGMANIPDQFTGTGTLFARKFNCTGKATEVRRVSAGVFEVRFVGNTARSAVGSAVNDAYADVEPAAGGAFRVTVHPAGRDDETDLGFTLVAI